MTYEMETDSLIQQLCNISIDNKFIFAKEEVRARARTKRPRKTF